MPRDDVGRYWKFVAPVMGGGGGPPKNLRSAKKTK